MKKGIITTVIGGILFVLSLVFFIISCVYSYENWGEGGWQFKANKDWVILILIGLALIALGVYYIVCKAKGLEENKNVTYIVVVLIALLATCYILGTALDTSISEIHAHLHPAED